MTNLTKHTAPTSMIPSVIQDYSRKVRKALFKPKLTILSISLLNGRFKALSIINDTIHLSWERPGLVVSTETLRQAIQDAIHHTQYQGTYVAILVEDTRFITKNLQLPPMSPSDLIPILERKAQQEKNWDGQAAWCHRIGLKTRENGKVNIHLEIWPQEFVDQIVQICQELGLHLCQLGPISSLSESQLSMLPVEPGMATLLLTILEGKITFVCGKEDGTPLLTRHLFPTQDWVPLGERVGTEVNRTIMYITQQTNLSIPHIWFLGEEDHLTIGEIQPHVPTEIFPGPVNPDWKYWLWVGATLPIDHPNNFTPTHVLREPLRIFLTKAVAAIIVGFLILGVGTTSALQGFLAQNKDIVQAVSAKATILQQNQEQWQSRLVALQTQRQWAQAITAPVLPPLEGPFFSYLSTVIPPQIILHRAVMERTSEGWNLELSGRSATNLSTTLLALDQLVKHLGEGPYHVALQPDWRAKLLTQTTTSSGTKATSSLIPFTMKGTLS